MAALLGMSLKVSLTVHVYYKKICVTLLAELAPYYPLL